MRPFLQSPRGRTQIAGEIAKLIPDKHYFEIFGTNAAVFLAKTPTNYEGINFVDIDFCNAFKDLLHSKPHQLEWPFLDFPGEKSTLHELKHTLTMYREYPPSADRFQLFKTINYCTYGGDGNTLVKRSAKKQKLHEQLLDYQQRLEATMLTKVSPKLYVEDIAKEYGQQAFFLCDFGATNWGPTKCQEFANYLFLLQQTYKFSVMIVTDDTILVPAHAKQQRLKMPKLSAEHDRKRQKTAPPQIITVL